METKKINKERDRVILSLKTEQAEELTSFLETFGDHREVPGIEKISKRITKALNKQKVLRQFKKQGIIPSKEQIKKAMEVLK